MSSDDAGGHVADDRDAVSGTASAEQREDGSTPAKPSSSFIASKKAFLVVLAINVVAFGVAAVFGVLWWTTTAGDKPEVAEARDGVITAASRAIRAFTQFDHEDLNQFRTNQMAVSTEDMQSQIEQTWPNLREEVVKSRRSASTTIFDIAVDELNVGDGKASVIAALEVRVDDAGETVKKRIRIQAQMERVEDSWKLAGIGQVPVEAGS